MLQNKETKRERVKDVIIHDLMLYVHGSTRDWAYETACGMADRVFEVLGINETEQDKP